MSWLAAIRRLRLRGMFVTPYPILRGMRKLYYVSVVESVHGSVAGAVLDRLDLIRAAYQYERWRTCR